MTKTILKVALAACLMAGSSFATAQQTPPSGQYQPAGAPPVSIRPTGQGQNSYQTTGQTPQRVSPWQQQQFAPRPNESGSNQSNMPPRVHRLTDAEMPNLSTNFSRRPQAGTPPSKSQFPPVIQKTAYLKQQETTKPSNEPFVPEILREKVSPPTQQQSSASPSTQDPPVVPLTAQLPVVDQNSFETVQNTAFESGDQEVDATVTNNGVNPPSKGFTPTVEDFAEPETLSTPIEQNSPLQEQSSHSDSNDFQNLRNTAIESQSGQRDIQVNSATPGITVSTLGPKSIGIGKTSSYQIKIQNTSSMDSNRLELSFRLPKWVDIANVITTDGHRDVTQEPNNYLVKWVLSRVAGGQAQTMTVDLVPKKAEAFDLDVQWTMDKVQSIAKISVTEPRLEMNIVGPDEVQFGQKAIYNVTVKNVGTGSAESVQVMLSEALGGARASLDSIAPGADKKFQVELSARSPGELELLALAVGDANLRTSSSRKIMVRRAKLDVAVNAPPMKYAGTVSTYEIQIKNSGDALAKEVTASVNLPLGVKYLSGLTGATANQNSLAWTVGNLAPGEQRVFKVNCQLNAAGKVKVDVGVRGSNDLVAANFATTTVETIADLVLTVEDPKGPLPTGEQLAYTIKIKNRGSRTANTVDLVMHFSKGIEPSQAEGLDFKTAPGEITFSPIGSIEPGEEISVKVLATAMTAGTHKFRAQLSCAQSDSHEVAQGTTKFYGNSIQKEGVPARPASSANQFQQNNQLPPTTSGGDFGGGNK